MPPTYVTVMGEKIERGTQDGYVSFGDVARKLCHNQCQYAFRHLIKDHPDYAYLGDDIRVYVPRGDIYDYHFIEIHEDDVQLFVQRYNDHARERGWR